MKMKDTVKVTTEKSSTERRTQLLNGHSAPTAFYKEVYLNICAGVAAMHPGKLYTAKMLVLDGYWDSLITKNWKALAGRCFAHMVSCKVFPIKFVQYKKSRTKHYEK